MIATSPAQITVMRLASLRAMLRMEKVGMKTRGGSLRPRIAAEFGLSARASHDVFIDHLTSLIEATIAANNASSEPSNT